MPKWTQSRAPLTVVPSPGTRGRKSSTIAAMPKRYLYLLERPVVAAQAEQREGEERDADHDPEALLERVARSQPVDLGHADRGQEPRHRQQVRVGVRHRHARDDVRGEVEREEEQRVAERAPADDRLPRDVDGCEADARQDADDAEVEELAVAVGQRASPQPTSTTIRATRIAITSSASTCLPKLARSTAGSAGAAGPASEASSSARARPSCRRSAAAAVAVRSRPRGGASPPRRGRAAHLARLARRARPQPRPWRRGRPRRARRAPP